MEESAACESKGTTHWWFYMVSFTRVLLAWDEMEMNSFNRTAKKEKCLPNGQGGKQVVIILGIIRNQRTKTMFLSISTRIGWRQFHCTSSNNATIE